MARKKGKRARRVKRSLAQARKHHKRGYQPIPVAQRSKKPTVRNWQKLQIGWSNLPEYFTEEDQNIGVLLGAPSGWLIDMDLDCPEAIRLANDYLPSTPAVFGRRSAPRSHRLYRAPELAPKKFSDPIDGSMLLEIRSTGQQTVFPGSVHESGERIEWQKDGEPSRIDASDLQLAAGELAAASFLARHWDTVGSRDELAAALIGTLVRSLAWDADAIYDFVDPILVVAEDEEAESRLRKIERTVEQIGNDHMHFYGLPKLAEILGQKAVDQLLRWLPATVESKSLVLRSAYEIATEVIVPRFIHKPYLEEGVLAVLSGEYSTYKSFLALDWALHAAAGKRWPSEEQSE